MSMVIHHVEIGVLDGQSALNKFVSQYEFCLVAKRLTDFCSQWVLQKGQVRFLLTELNRDREDLATKCAEDSYAVLWDKPSPQLDSVFNVAVEVKDIENYVNRVIAGGGRLVKPLSSVDSPQGHIQLSVVQSCVGNVVHSIINSEHYTGVFLPGFTPCTQISSVPNPSAAAHLNITHIDHVTFACEADRSSEVQQWYEACFGMKRFLIHRDEDENEGFVVEHGDLGVRLKAMEYWRCAEVGLHQGTTNDLVFVIAESLHRESADQLNVFLSDHGGEGIQHIGLHTPCIQHTVADLRRNGVPFTEPPYTYYTEVGKVREICEMGESIEELQKHGILLDKESEPDRYLMQKFTKPLFGRRTFFLEVIQRVGATGFGAGNITALWQSVQAYLTETTGHSGH